MGSTCIDTQNFSDNCDEDHPAVINLYIPSETVKLNKLRLTYKVRPYRGYTRGTKEGGAGTGKVKGAEATVTSEENEEETIETNNSGGYEGTTDEKSFDEIETSTQEEDEEESEDHRHKVDIPDHDHEIEINEHKHEVTIPSHTHKVKIGEADMEVEIADHRHDQEFGIFEEEEDDLADEVTVEIDGNEVEDVSTNEKDLDIVEYLETDSDDKVKRSEWHEIRITPNKNARILANVFNQLFLQSRGGGDY